MIEIRTIQGTPLERVKKVPLNGLNRNILIVGSSGTGKSTLMREAERLEPPKLKLIFKNDGERAFSLAANRPFLEKDRTNFIDAWKGTLHADSAGYMLIQEQIILEQLRQRGQSLPELRSKLRQAKERAEKIDTPIYSLIENRLAHLYPSYTSEIHSEGKISLEGLSEDEYLFFSDYILRSSYDLLENEVIAIDEMHRLRPLLETTISRITREIRSRGGLIASTQSMSDLPPALTNNFGTIFSFQDIDIRDLRYFAEIDKELKQDVLNLEEHEFIEVRGYKHAKLLGMAQKMILV